MIIQYDITLSFNEHPILMRVGLIAALGSTILRVLLEPIMIGALGAMVGAAIPARIPAIVITVIFGAAYFALINLARMAPLDEAGRLFVEILVPTVLPLIIIYLSLRTAEHLLVRD
jgi:hypothetical protein